jgi:hypothetical protein
MAAAEAPLIRKRVTFEDLDSILIKVKAARGITE